MEFAFSSILVRLSGVACVVLTSLLPLQGQIITPPTPERASTAGTDARRNPAQPPSPAVTDEPSGNRASGDLPDLKVPPLPSPADSDPVNVPAEHDANAPANDADSPQNVSRSPRSPITRKGQVADISQHAYPFLNYVPLSCDAAFDESEGDVSEWILTSGLYAQNEKSESDNTPPGALPAALDSQNQNLSERSSTNAPLTKTTKRTMSEIRLGESLKSLSETGEPLPTPESIEGDSSAPKTVEHHFVPAPWVRSHPSRNTFPIRYQPLYFEDPNMERCGDSNGLLTEATSIVHFGARIPLLPYLMASDSPHECVNALPDCPTCSQFGRDAYLPRPTVKAIAAQAAATVAGVYIIP